MNKLKFCFLALAAFLWGCQQAEMLDPNENGGQTMKSVTISADMTASTKASLDSETGQFAWQSGDVISVLATDGKFYEFTLNEGEGNWKAEFTGTIPVDAQITTVATYPALTPNATENTLLNETTLNYVLPSEWTWVKEVSNVPMVAAFEAGTEYMSFKQVGGVMRFPVKNMPAKGTFALTMTETHFTGEFPIDITKLGETAMVAGGAPQTKSDDGFKDVVIEVLPDVYTETLKITYDADIDGDLVEFNVPVPTGTYTNFYLQILDDKGAVMFEKKYVKENKVERATLLNMSMVELPARNMAAPAEVWPYFVDARVVLPNVSEGETQYAVFVDGGDPVIKDIELVNGKATVVCGGDFAHNSTHTVAIAKVLDGVVLTSTKSAEVEFTTAGVRQLTTNTGTKFVSVGWDDVALEGGPKFVDGKWTAVKANNYPDLDEFGRKLHQKRGYQVQLFADDKTTLLYDMIPFDGHSIHQNAFYDSNTIGKLDGHNLLTPTALSFSHLEPGKDYYFRVKSLEGVVNMNVDNGNYNPEDTGDKAYPYPLSSERGGSGWSEFVKLSTDPVHVASENEIFHEGFDDIMIASDYVNWAVGVVPDLDATKRQSWSDYLAGAKTAYSAFLQTPVEQRKWTVHGFNQRPTVDQYGMIDGGYVANAENVLNANAGSMKGWILKTAKVERNIYPMFGAIAIGQAINSHGGSSLATPPISSEKLNDETPTKCVVTMKVSYISANKVPPAPKRIYLARYKDGATIGESAAVDVSELCVDEWNSYYVQHHTDANNYINYQHLFEVKHEMQLKNGESIWIEKTTEGSNANKEYGWYIIGDIKVEVIPEVVAPTFKDDGVGTEPDDTDYDVYGLGEFPVSHWYTVEPSAYTNADGTYNDELTKQRYQEMKDAGINTTIYYGHSLNYSIPEQKRILGICEELGLNFIGYCPEEGTQDRISEIKSQLAPSEYYLGECIADEPSAANFDALGQYTKAFLEAMPEKDVYVNLYPMYAKTNNLGTSTYEQHIDQYLEKVPTKALSFDYYPFFKNGIGDNFFTNMDLVRSKTVARRMPFWMITQAGKVNDNLLPTEKQERWSVWAAIALGSKGISYFCYWTPSGDNFVDVYMIDKDGNKTEFYDIVKSLNADIKTIGKKLLPCHADGAIMTATKYYPLFENDGAGRTHYGPVKEVSGSESVLCGCFRDARKDANGENYKGYKNLVMSQMPDRNIEAYLTLDSSVNEITITYRNTTETVQVSNSLNTTVGGATVSFDGAKLILGIPEGDAVLLEF